MRRGRLFLLVALLLIVILAAVFILSGGLSIGTPSDTVETSIEPTSTPVPVTVNVVVVTQKVTRGTDFTEDVLGLVEIPKDLQIPGTFTDVNEIIGYRARFDLDSGVILTSSMITESADQFSTTGSDWALLIPPGKVAVSIPISRLSSVAYGPQKGDHVNVIVSLLMVDVDAGYQSILPNYTAAVIAPGPQGAPGESPVVLSAQVVSGGPPSAEGRIQPDETLQGEEDETFFYYVVPSELQRPRLVSQTLIQDAIVLQVGNFPLEEEEEAAPTPTPEFVGEEEGGVADQGETAPVVEEAPPPPPDMITLIVSPQDAVTLNYLIYSGAKLNLALRPANDAALVQTEAVTMQYLLDVYSIPVPVKLPFALAPRVDELAQPELPNDVLAPTPTPVP